MVVQSRRPAVPSQLVHTLSHVIIFLGDWGYHLASLELHIGTPVFVNNSARRSWISTVVQRSAAARRMTNWRSSRAVNCLVPGRSIGQRPLYAAGFPRRQSSVARRGLIADCFNRLGHVRSSVELPDDRQAILVPWAGRSLRYLPEGLVGGVVVQPELALVDRP